MTLLELEWWVYLFILFSFFIICLVLNYIVKKVNEAKLDERFNRMRHKVATTRSTQVQGALIEINRANRTQYNPERTHAAPAGISLVFNREDNKRRKDIEDTINIIKNTIDMRKFEALSLNTNVSSQETTVQSSPQKQSEYNVADYITAKKKESGRIVIKEDSCSNRSDTNVGREVGVESRHISIKEPQFHAQCVNSESECISVMSKECRRIIKETMSLNRTDNNENDDASTVNKTEPSRTPAKETTTNNQSNKNLIELVTAKNKEPKCFDNKKDYKTPTDNDVREVIPLKNKEGTTDVKESIPKIQSNNNKNSSIPVKTKESGRIMQETASSSKSNKDVTEVAQVKTRESRSLVITEDSFHQSDTVQGSIPIKDKVSSHIIKKDTSSPDRKDNIPVIQQNIDKKSDSNENEFVHLNSKKSTALIIKQSSGHDHFDNIRSEVPLKIKDSNDVGIPENLVSNLIDNKLKELILVQNKEPNRIAVKESTSRNIPDDNNENNFISVNNKSSGRIDKIANKQIDTNTHTIFPVSSKKSTGIVIKESPHGSQTEINVKKLISIKNKLSSGVVIKDSLDSVKEPAPVKKNESSRILIKETSSRNKSILSESVAVKNEPGGCSKEFLPIVETTSNNRNDKDKINEINPVKKIASGRILVKESSSQNYKDNKVSEIGPANKIASGRIMIRDISAYNQNDNTAEMGELKNIASGRIVVDENATLNQGDNNEFEFNPTNSSDTDASARIVVKHSSSFFDSYVSEFVPIPKNESGHTEIETSILDISLNDSKDISAIKKPNDDISLSSGSKERADSSTLKASTSKPTNSEQQREKGLTDWIKDMVPVLNEDFIIIKPNSSTKTYK